MINENLHFYFKRFMKLPTSHVLRRHGRSPVHYFFSLTFPAGCGCLSFSYLLERVKDIIICHPNSLKPWYGRLGQLFVPHNPCTQRWEVMFVKMCAEPT